MPNLSPPRVTWGQRSWGHGGHGYDISIGCEIAKIIGFPLDLSLKKLAFQSFFRLSTWKWRILVLKDFDFYRVSSRKSLSNIWLLSDSVMDVPESQ